MKDEIKEILDNLKYTAKKHTIQVLEYGGNIEHCPQEVATEMRLNTYSAKILLDYITNLEQEKQEMKDGWQQEVYDKDKILNKWLDLRVRIDKAIECMKSNSKINLEDGTSIVRFYKDLLNILTGGDDNETKTNNN